jgi:hypothetical protein
MAEPLAAGAVTVLDRQAEWSAADVADSNRWTYQLSDTDLVELTEALAVARSAADDVLDVSRETFPLPTLSVRLSEIADELINGRGFQRISGLPVEQVGTEDSSWIYWGIGLHLGVPWPQNAKGHLLGDVKDQGKRPDDPTARGNELGGVGQVFHSDGSDLVGLLCLDPGVRGGESLIANAVRAHNQLVVADPELAGVLYGGLPYDFRGEQRDGGDPYYRVPAFSRHRDRLFVRYIRPYIEASQRHPDAPRLSDDQRAAMDAFDALLTATDNQVEMTFAAGDMQFINNYHVLHGRRSYVDDPTTGRVRWLKRLWLATDLLGPEDRPERFQAAGATTHWAARRSKA